LRSSLVLNHSFKFSFLTWINTYSIVIIMLTLKILRVRWVNVVIACTKSIVEIIWVWFRYQSFSLMVCIHGVAITSLDIWLFMGRIYMSKSWHFMIFEFIVVWDRFELVLIILIWWWRLKKILLALWWWKRLSRLALNILKTH
jgi:hypothetical protein